MREPNRNYQPLKDAVVNDTNVNEQSKQSATQHPEPIQEVEDVEERFAAYQKELEEQVKQGRIDRKEMDYQLKRFDNELVVEMNLEEQRREAALPDRSSSDTRDHRDRQDQQGNEKNSAPKREEHSDNPEMSDARAARKERLRGIDKEIEQEFRENAENMLDRDRGDRSR